MTATSSSATTTWRVAICNDQQASLSPLDVESISAPPRTCTAAITDVSGAMASTPTHTHIRARADRTFPIAMSRSLLTATNNNNNSTADERLLPPAAPPRNQTRLHMYPGCTVHTPYMRVARRKGGTTHTHNTSVRRGGRASESMCRHTPGRCRPPLSESASGLGASR